MMFYHSILSDWNHGNAHFLRGVVSELLSRGHDVAVYEPRDSWSFNNLVLEHGYGPVDELLLVFPWLRSNRYELERLDLDRVLDGAGMVIVHEWNSPELVRRAGEYRKSSRGLRLFFHDTHHRSVTSPFEMEAFDLSGYDGVLAFGETVKDIYLRRGWAERAWTWHEAADTRVFYPTERMEPDGDLVWIGNWGDGERTRDIEEFITGPARSLGLRARLHGVRYPSEAVSDLESAGIEYGGWVPNYAVPEVYARHKFTMHVPRRPYTESLPGIPTIRVFEALACGMPLLCAPWEDSERLFSPGKDFIVARNGEEARRAMRDLANDPSMRRELASNGLGAIDKRHTCAHRVDELLGIYAGLNMVHPGGAWA